MRIHRGPGVDATILGAATLFALALGNGNTITGAPERYNFVAPRAVVTEDIRVDGSNLLPRDDSGLRTTVIVADGALKMAGQRLRKR